MNINDISHAIEELRSKGDMVMDRIANYIEANADDFMDCFKDNCPECGCIGWDTGNDIGEMKCENGHSWCPE